MAKLTRDEKLSLTGWLFVIPFVVVMAAAFTSLHVAWAAVGLFAVAGLWCVADVVSVYRKAAQRCDDSTSSEK